MLTPGPDPTVAMFIGYEWSASLQPPADGGGKKGETFFLNRIFKIAQEKKKKWGKRKIGRAAMLSLGRS